MLVAMLIVKAPAALGYDGDVHQQLIFLAARQYNECVKDSPELRLSALQVRYAAKAAVKQAEAGLLRRMFRWGFYEREEQSPKSMLWVVETRMHEHFNQLESQLAKASSDADKFSVAGRIATYVQDVTSPVRVVPIYTAKFWRLTTNDRFNKYPLDDRALSQNMDDVCGALFEGSTANFADILKETADKSLRAVVEPIPGMPTTWQAFWRLSRNPGDFGDYGRAGNRFGSSTSFKCGKERCVLLKDDPLYGEFAAARHADAVIGTMKVLHQLQLQRLPGELMRQAIEDNALPQEQNSEKEQNSVPDAISNPGSNPGSKDGGKDADAERALARSQVRNITANE